MGTARALQVKASHGFVRAIVPARAETARAQYPQVPLQPRVMANKLRRPLAAKDEAALRRRPQD